MRVLVISDEVWNDKIHGNNVLTNWFAGFPAEFANIYCSPGIPHNFICKKYFQITDKMMLKSIVTKEKAGVPFEISEQKCDVILKSEKENRNLYGLLKSISGDFMRALREIIWCLGKYDLSAMEQFVSDFQPDIIFSPRLATLKILRLERIVHQIAKVPLVAFTGDNEYSLRVFKISPFFWIRRFILRKKLRNMMKNYAMYYTLSDEQQEEYHNAFGREIKILRKCGDFSKTYYEKKTGEPIRLVYIGKVYCNRWKSLAKVGKALKKINSDQVRMILDIYTKDSLSKWKKKKLSDGRNIFVKGAVSPEDIMSIYEKSDIALHVESFDVKNKLATRVSFSTKIIDCLASSCAVMAICWKEHSGYTYLKKEDAAICIDDLSKIEEVLSHICASPQLIDEYRRKALECGRKNHTRKQMMDMLYRDFNYLMNRK